VAFRRDSVNTVHRQGVEPRREPRTSNGGPPSSCSKWSVGDICRVPHSSEAQGPGPPPCGGPGAGGPETEGSRSRLGWGLDSGPSSLRGPDPPRPSPGLGVQGPYKRYVQNQISAWEHAGKKAVQANGQNRRKADSPTLFLPRTTEALWSECVSPKIPMIFG
jgi:hypothetical protein